MDYVERYFEDAVRIYAICGDEQLSDEVARLLTYIHAKGSESGKGIEYFNDPPECDREALEFMTGEARLGDVAAPEDAETIAIADTFIAATGDRIASLDRKLEQDHGLERRISGELRGRLRLYRDADFRAKMIQLYSKKIAPRIFSYTPDNVNRSFMRFRERSAEAEGNFRQMLDE